MTEALALRGPDPTARAILLPPNADKDTTSRIETYLTWLGDRPWTSPDLAGYRDELLGRGLAPVSVSAYVSTLRARFQDAIDKNTTRDLLYAMAARDIPENESDPKLTLLARKAYVDEYAQRLTNDLNPKASKVKVPVVQDKTDSDHLRLTKSQARALLAAPGNSDLLGIRNTALIALGLCTGAREAELCALEVRDLRQKKEGVLALHIREGKNKKTRLVPYGGLEWCLALVDRWLALAGITSGFVFRPMWKSQKLRPGPLSCRTVQKTMKRYPIMIDGKSRAVRCHDLRRTYAKRLYVAGVDLKAIQENLGHSDMKTTLGYIGDMDFSDRKPPAVYDFGWQEWTQEGLTALVS